jgi:AraC-like DNA-binding protein
MKELHLNILIDSVMINGTNNLFLFLLDYALIAEIYPMKLIFFIGAIQAFFWVLLILNKRSKRSPDYILATWLFVIGVNIFLVYLHYTDFNYRWWPYHMGINAGIPAMHGPFLLLYIQFQQGKFENLKLFHALHLVPAFIIYLTLLPQFLMPKEELIYWIENIAPLGEPKLHIIGFVNSVTGVVYIVWSWIELRRHRRKVNQYFSYTQDVSLSWLRNLIAGLAIIWLTVLFSQFVFWVLSDALHEFFTSDQAIFFVASLFVFFIGYYGIQQGVIFSTPSLVPEAISNSLDEKAKYERSGLKREKAEELARKVAQFMEVEKPYLESRLALNQLADRMGVPKNHLSQVVNDQLNSNFYEFINRYRVEEFKRRIRTGDKKNLTILGHAYDSGFSSKSAFNDIFKKLEGVTPSDFVLKRTMHTEIDH